VVVFMALLRSRCEADRLTSQHTKQSLRTQPSTTLGSKQPYRESGLVLWPVSACQARAEKQPFMNLAQLSDWAAMSPAAAVNVPVAACPSH